MTDTFDKYYQLIPEKFVRVELFGSVISNTYVHDVISKGENLIILFHESFVENEGIKSFITSTWNMRRI